MVSPVFVRLGLSFGSKPSFKMEPLLAAPFSPEKSLGLEV